MKAAFAFLALLAVASAARWDEKLWNTWAQGSSHQVERKSKDYTEKTARIKFTYFVDPSMHKEFIDEWRKMEEKVAEEKGNRLYDLKKSTTDNVMFMGYGEWDSFDDWMRHSEEDYVEEFIKWVGENEVHYHWEPLFKAADEDVKPAKGDKTRDRDMTHVLIKYHVPGHLHRDFVSVWQDTQKDTCKEKHNRIYGLRKSATDNQVFYTYGTWDDMRAYIDHIESDHVHELLKWTAEKDITWFLEPLIKVGSQPE